MLGEFQGQLSVNGRIIIDDYRYNFGPFKIDCEL